MKTSHFNMPLYSFRFLSAGRPKQRSNSVWEESTSTRHLGGRVRTARPNTRYSSSASFFSSSRSP